MVENIEVSQQKRNIAYKMRIGNIHAGKQVIDGDKLRCVEVGDKRVVRVNVIANVTDKFIQEGEKQYGSITLDDATGQIRVKVFGDDLAKVAELNQGDTILVVGLLRGWNNEVYITPEIIKKKDPAFLLVRKLEIEGEAPVTVDKEVLAVMKDKILALVKDAEKDGGVDIDKLIMDLHESPEVINQEIKKLLEDGVAYEPRPGKLRYLG